MFYDVFIYPRISIYSLYKALDLQDLLNVTQIPLTAPHTAKNYFTTSQCAGTCLYKLCIKKIIIIIIKEYKHIQKIKPVFRMLRKVRKVSDDEIFAVTSSPSSAPNHQQIHSKIPATALVVFFWLFSLDFILIKDIQKGSGVYWSSEYN